MFFGGTALCTQQDLQLLNFLTVLSRVNFKSSFRRLDFLRQADEEGFVLPDEGQLVLEAFELRGLQIKLTLLIYSKHLSILLALLGDVINLSVD